MDSSCDSDPGDSGDSGGDDTGDNDSGQDDTDDTDDTDPGGDRPATDKPTTGECGCASVAGADGGWLAVLALLLVSRRRSVRG